MTFINVTASTQQRRAEELEDLLWGCGSVSVTLIQDDEQALFEPGVGETPVWQQVRVVGLFEGGADVAEVVQQMSARGFAGSLEAVADRVWEREWLARFKPRRFGERLWISPIEHVLPPIGPNEVVVRLDPGLAFGTGDHATTRLCLGWLDAHIMPGMRVMDYGCGSGVLGIAAAMLGASHVAGVDTDPQALRASEDNCAVNGTTMDLVHPHGVRKQADFDVVVANILAEPLVELAGRLSGLLVRGGLIALSGVMTAQRQRVLDAYSAHLDGIEVQEDDGWLLLAGRKS